MPAPTVGRSDVLRFRLRQHQLDLAGGEDLAFAWTLRGCAPRLPPVRPRRGGGGNGTALRGRRRQAHLRRFQAALQAGLELEPGTSPPVLHRIPDLRPPLFGRPAGEAEPRFDVIRNYLRF